MSDPTTTIYDFIAPGVGALAGAFFAFIFLKFAEFLSRIHQRKVKHYNSIVLLEIQLNEIIGRLSDNISAASDFIKIITSGKIYFGKLMLIPIDKSHYDNLYDVNLKNDLFSFYYKLRQLNIDIENINVGYTDIKNALIQQNIDDATYLENSKMFSTFLTKLKGHLNEISDSNKYLYSKVRILSKKDLPLSTKISRWFIRSSSPKIKKSEIDEEQKKLEDEINNTEKRIKENKL